MNHFPMALNAEIDTLGDGINSSGDPQSVSGLYGGGSNPIVAVETFPVGGECTSKRNLLVEMTP